MNGAAMRQETVKPASAYYDLAQLIAPISVETFFDEYYEKKPLLIQRYDRTYYEDLFTLSDLDRSLMVANHRADHTRVVIEGEETPITELLASSSGDENARGNELEVIYQRLREGYTIVLNSIHERQDNLMRLCRALDNGHSFNPQANIYLTPPENRGFRPHYDTHDVFITQMYGSKRWYLHGVAADLPLRNQPWRTPESGPPEVTQDFVLEAGDLLYLPRGTVHAGTSTHETSMHLTLGLHPVLWSEVFKKAAQKVVENDIVFRRALPAGFTHDAAARALAEDLAKQLTDAFVDQLADPATMLAEPIWERVVNQRHPELLGHLVDLQNTAAVKPDTRVRRRSETQALFGIGQDTASLSFNGKSVEFPADIAPVLRAVAERDDAPFTPAEITGDLDEAGRVVLVTVLLNEGYLTHA